MNYLVVGAGNASRPVARLLNHLGHNVIITDLKEIKELVPNIETVTTKKALGRNVAEFIEKDIVLNNIYNGVKTALTKEIKPIFAPENLKTEMRYTRMEDAEIFLKKAVKMGLNAKYGEDAHTIIFNTEKIDDIPLLV